MSEPNLHTKTSAWATQWSALSTQPHQPSPPHPPEGLSPGGLEEQLGNSLLCSPAYSPLRPCYTQSGPGSQDKMQTALAPTRPISQGPPLPYLTPRHLPPLHFCTSASCHLPAHSTHLAAFHWEHLLPKCLLCSLLCLHVCRSPLWGLTQPSVFCHTFKCNRKLIA